MKMEQPPTAANDAEANWVEGELVRNLMRTQRSTQWIGGVLIAIVVAVLWPDAARGPLLAWAAAGAGAALARFWVIRRYEREVVDRGPADLVAFFNRYRAVWPLSALVWGLATLLWFDRSSLADQFICWLIIAGLAMFSINTLSSQRATMAAYLNTLALTTLAVMAWRMGFQLGLQGPTYHWWVVLLLLTFWQGRRTPARNAAAQLRAAVPQQPADRVAYAADPGGPGRRRNQEPLPGQRRP